MDTRTAGGQEMPQHPGFVTMYRTHPFLVRRVYLDRDAEWLVIRPVALITYGERSCSRFTC